MRKLLLGAAAAAILAGCSNDGSSADFSTAGTVLEAMKLDGGEGGRVSFADDSRSGGSASFSDIVIKDDEGEDMLRADSLVIDGMTMTDDVVGFETLTFSGLEALGLEDGVSVSLNSIVLEEPNAPTAAFVASLFSGDALEEPPAPADWAFGKLAFKGLSVDAAFEDETDQGVFSMTLDEVSIDALADMVAGKALLQGLKGDFDVQSDDSDVPFPIVGDFEWDVMSVDGLRGEWLGAVIEAGDDPEALAGINISDYFDSPIEPGYDGLVMEGLSVDVSGVKVDMPKSTARVERNSEGVATRVFSPEAKFTLEASPEDGGLGAMLGSGLGMMGYEGVELYAESDARFDPATDETRLKTSKFGMKDGFDLSVEGGFQNLMEAFRGLGAEEPDLEALQNLTVNDFSVTLTDQSLLDRALNVVGLMQGASADELRGMMVMGLAFAGPELTAMGLGEDVSNELLTALSGFIQEPGELTISLTPETPLRFGDLAEGGDLSKATLGFSATNTPGGG